MEVPSRGDSPRGPGAERACGLPAYSLSRGAQLCGLHPEHPAAEIGSWTRLRPEAKKLIVSWGSPLILCAPDTLHFTYPNVKLSDIISNYRK